MPKDKQKVPSVYLHTESIALDNHDDGLKACPSCGGRFKPMGLPRHKATCIKRMADLAQDLQLDKQLRKEKKEAKKLEKQFAVGSSSKHVWENTDTNFDVEDNYGSSRFHDAPPVGLNFMGESLQIDDIKTEYHPTSGRTAKVDHFSDFKRGFSGKARIKNSCPWQPFKSRVDFEFAEVALEAALNKDQINRLVKVIHQSIQDPGSFTLKDQSDLYETWKIASHALTPFEKTVINVPYQGKDHSFDVHFRSLWDWALDLLGNPHLSEHFVFDAERLSKFNGDNFVQFIDEPWTAGDFWDIQSRLPDGGKPLCFILYADKTILSSFGTVKGYPVIARCANLPTDIRNGTGVGGGRVVGWLPVVPEDEEHKVVESLELHAKTGYYYQRTEGDVLYLFPIILILSADYEEHAHSESILLEAEQQQTAADKEIVLKNCGLRPVKNVFWRFRYSDVHQALSWDRLHAHNSGLWGHHLWKEFLFWIEAEGRAASHQLDNQFNGMPRWRNLNHFDRVASIEFSDATKHEDISKMVIFASHNIFDVRLHKPAHLLLKSIRLFLDVDMYTGLTVHTTETIAAGRQALKLFSQAMDEYLKAADGLRDKSWNFPKMHMNKHAFEDIEAKGVTRNYNTKPNEQLHGPLKDSYRFRTNFKHVAEQILQADHWCLVSCFIRQDIAAFDSQLMGDLEGDEVDLKITETSHVSLGSKCPATSFQGLEEARKDDTAFTSFRIRLSNYLNIFFSANNIAFPGGKRIKLGAEDKITEYCFMKVDYESIVDWRQYTDYLRCNPWFYNHPQYDCVLLQTVDSRIFARLIMLFICTIDQVDYPFALVQPYDAPSRSDAEFVPLRSIVRGAAMAPDYEVSGDFFLIDTVDSDWFLRTKKMWSELPAKHT
ncbi:hypothetical protein SERLADRAFT_438878 [Serpula lacrymans var. lacrymans S7.9]|uniref:Uncharacterized protein n=1 Tax=Serpula lacrymans var. lacrymans (strain S7.9) TaxID=578457 RepID=F8NY86_SERL9|nr:uncharacterized protein SERLADRAFT_438878 [Serpula lacrymans var. lacrymans S7.9]EGO23558.1 hypothetical protein SERLADRAFT_438878 [Serpula lacrymans var. lacrymans S7.9]